jgi:hypothetical protein
MKTSKTIFLSALILILLSITSFIIFLKYNFERNCIEGNGKKINKEINLQHFTGVYLNSPMNVEIKQDSIQKVMISTDENILEAMDIMVKDNILNIGRKTCIKGMDHITITVTTDSLTKIDLNSGGRMKSVDTIRGNNLEAHVSSGANLEIKMAYSQLNCTLSAGAQAWFVGKADNMEAELNSGSNLKTSELETNNCKVNVSSGAKAIVNTSGELIVDANSGGILQYSGNPTKLNINKNSGGTVSKIE